MVASPARKPLIAPSKNDGPFSSPEKQNVVVCLLLAAVTLCLYNAVNRHPFLNCDDDRYVTQNTHIRGISGDTIVWAFTTTAEANWHPLTWLSHALDYQLFHLNAAGHHLTSLMIHCVNVVLLFLLLARATRRVAPSLFVAALFAVHPINVESVAWVAERKNLLCTFFFFLTLWAYGWYTRKPEWRRYLAVAALFAMGLMSKPMVITLPLALLLLDYWPLGRIEGSPSAAEYPVQQRPFSKLLIEKLPLLALSAASAWITVLAQRAGGAVRSMQQFPLGVRLENSIVAYGMYLWKTIWPSRLAVLYPHPGNSRAGWRIAVGAANLVAISGFVLRFRSRGYLVVGWLWFLGTLVPVIGLVQVGYQAMADRYAYVPVIGIFVMIAFGSADLARVRKLGPFLSMVPAASVLIVLALVTHRQIGYWQSSINLWTRTLAVTENNFVAEDNMGGALVLDDREEEAFPHFQAAARINPLDPMSRSNIGTYLLRHGRLREAVTRYKEAIGLTSDAHLLAQIQANLGSAYRDLSDEKDARESYDRALEINPGQFNAYLGRGVLFEKQGKLAQAIGDFSKSVEIEPTAEGYLRLGQALAEAQRREEALEAFREALKISPDLTEAQQAVAALSARH